MTAVLLWAIGALIVAAIAPNLLTAMMRRGVDSHVMLATWAAVVAGTLVSIVVPVALSLVPRHGGVSALGNVAHRCWLALHEDAPARLEVAVGVAGTLALITAGVRLMIHLHWAVRTRRTVHDQHIGLLRILGDARATAGSTLWLPLDSPLAYSVAGRPALVVASNGLRTHLDPQAVSAVLAHEHAHIRGRHHLLVGIAESLAFAFPWLPIMRRSPALVRSLVEIEADARAAHSHGRDSVRRALQHLTPHVVPAPALGIACDGMELRLDRLSTDHTRRRAPVRIARAFAACGTAVLLPAVPVVALLGAMALASCAAV